MAAEENSGPAARTSIRMTDAGKPKVFIVAFLLAAILSGLAEKVLRAVTLEGSSPFAPALKRPGVRKALRTGSSCCRNQLSLVRHRAGRYNRLANLHRRGG